MRAEDRVCKSCSDRRVLFEVTLLSPRGAQNWADRLCLMINYLIAPTRRPARHPDGGLSPPCATDPHSHPDLLTPGTVGKPLARPFDGVFGSVGRLAVPRWRSLASADGWRAVPRGGSRWCGIGQLRAVHHTSVVLSLCRRHSAIAPARSLHHRLGACSTNIGTEGDERPITRCVCTPDSSLSRSACRPNT